jgi:hypothetical protein
LTLQHTPDIDVLLPLDVKHKLGNSSSNSIELS